MLVLRIVLLLTQPQNFTSPRNQVYSSIEETSLSLSGTSIRTTAHNGAREALKMDISKRIEIVCMISEREREGCFLKERQRSANCSCSCALWALPRRLLLEPRGLWRYTSPHTSPKKQTSVKEVLFKYFQECLSAESHESMASAEARIRENDMGARLAIGLRQRRHSASTLLLRFV